MAGISREHLNRIEAGKVTLTDDMQDKLMGAVEKFNPDAPMFLLFDYVRIRFPTLDIQHVIKDILKLNIDYMLHEDYGHYKYTEHYYLGDVFVYTSQDEEKGTLLELKGKGCRQFESYLLAQERSWYDFLMDALVEGGVMKRLDLAINDRAGILDIPDLTAKCNREECVSLFRSFKSYASGELVKHNEQDKAGMGHTLYIGSLKSEVYFCCYEKNYEQYAKLGVPIEEAPIKNRFEIRLKDERAYYAVRELLTHYDAEQTAFSIINHYIRFVDKEPEKRKESLKNKDKATAVKENIKDMPTQTAYAVHSAKEKAKANVSDFKRGIVQGQETRQSERADKLQQHRQNIADKRMELQKAQEAKQAGKTTDGSATTGATRPHERPVTASKTDTGKMQEIKRPATTDKVHTEPTTPQSVKERPLASKSDEPVPQKHGTRLNGVELNRQTTRKERNIKKATINTTKKKGRKK